MDTSEQSGVFKTKSFNHSILQSFNHLNQQLLKSQPMQSTHVFANYVKF